MIYKSIPKIKPKKVFRRNLVKIKKLIFTNMKLYMLLLGCRPKGRLTEQHDIFFGIGNSLNELIPQMKQSWPEAKGNIHIDAWREVTVVDNHSIEIVSKNSILKNEFQLFFINLGGYKENEFEEYHYKMMSVGASLAEATKKAKKILFYKLYNLKGAGKSHIDDKYGVDVDDIYNVKEILSAEFKNNYALKISKNESKTTEDTLHIGYLSLKKLL